MMKLPLEIPNILIIVTTAVLGVNNSSRHRDNMMRGSCRQCINDAACSNRSCLS
jgi:hypothetical protein